MIKTALLSRWHVHADEYAEQAAENPYLQIVKVWDEIPGRGEEWADKIGVPFEPELDKVLSDPDIDAVIVAAPTLLHTEILLKAAEGKKHIFTEKVLTASVEDCKKVLEAVERNHVILTLSLPRLTSDYYLYAQQALDQGLLGTLTTIRCRTAHNGAAASEEHPQGWLPRHFFDEAETGGGAFIDLGAHPIYLCNRLAGKPKSISARLQKSGFPVDVNSAVLAEYESGTLGILETSFLSGGSPFLLELYGTDGTLIIEDQKIRIKSRHAGNEWMVPDDVPPAEKMPLDQWADAIKENIPPSITSQDAFHLTLVNEMAALSEKENRRVEAAELE
ncbi:Gfo/Idh/MocA family protein [Peribacillus kribbensis]|uniref:Gfo/Idh/MocA family protein n=1 Tax=Peribacillus kribbensis TaxID=356658 RepID=UPI000402B055|nr:Gfo/Idh/MocA family oxidoreductase [Peribacillus kribbensis]